MYIVHIVFLAFLVCGTIVTATHNIRCYDCDPKSDGGCVDPLKFGNKITNCSDLRPTIGTKLKKEISDIDKLDVQPKTKNGIETDWECFSLYIKSSDNFLTAKDSAKDDLPPGVYRGCSEKMENVLSSCDFLKKQLKSGNVTDCKNCQDDECNVHDIGRGGASIAFSLVGLLLNVDLSLLMFNYY